MKAQAFLALAALAVSAAAQVDPNRTMVIVNGEEIKAEMYYRRMEVLPNVGRKVGDTFVPATPGFMTLQQLINETLILQLAKADEVYPSPEEVAADMVRRAKDDPAIKMGFDRLGLGEDLYRYDTLVEMCRFRVITKGINVTDFEVEKYYNDHKHRYFTIPKRLTLRMIALDDAAKKAEVDKDLAGGMSFGDAARKHSIGISATKGGELGDVPETGLSPLIKPHINGIEKGERTGWIEIQGKHLMYQVDDILAAEEFELDADLTRTIRRRLMFDKGNATRPIAVRLAQLRKEANIELQGTPFDDQIKSAFGGGQ
jgi:foldase protein PrsA